MTIDEINKSGFFRDFIEDYAENLIHFRHYNRTRLIFSLCTKEEEYTEATLKLLSKFKKIILKNSKFLDEYAVGMFRDIAMGEFAFDIWYEILSDAYTDIISTLTPISELFDDFLPDFAESFWGIEESKNSIDQNINLHIEKITEEFWNIYGQVKPKCEDLLRIMMKETELIELIKYEIEIKNKNGYWEFDFDDYKEFRKYSIPIKKLFEHAKIIASIHEFSILKDFIKRGKEQPNSPKNNLLSLSQIALKCFYEEKQITRKNCDEIVKLGGHHSGEKLYQYYIRYSSATNRKSVENTKRKTKNKIRLIESVIHLLPKNKNKRAKDELAILKNRYQKEFSL